MVKSSHHERQIRGLESWAPEKLQFPQANCSGKRPTRCSHSTDRAGFRPSPGQLVLPSSPPSYYLQLPFHPHPCSVTWAQGAAPVIPSVSVPFPFHQPAAWERVWPGFPNFLASNSTNFAKLPHSPHFPTETAATLSLQIRKLRSGSCNSNPAASFHSHNHLSR